MSLAKRLDPYLELVIPSVRRVERFLGPEDDWVEDDRRILYEAAQRHLGHLHTFTREKGPADYVTTVKSDPDTVEEALMPPYQRNLVSTRKYRTYHDGGKQYACGSFVIDGTATSNSITSICSRRRTATRTFTHTARRVRPRATSTSRRRTKSRATHTFCSTCSTERASRTTTVGIK